MNLQLELLKKNLNANFIKNSDDVVVQKLYLSAGTYHLTESYLRIVANFIKDEITSKIELGQEKYTVAGGSVLTLLMYGSPFLINDIDIFPASEEDYNSLKEKFDFEAKEKKVDIRENENSRCYCFVGRQIDLIKKFYPTTDLCLKSFDLTVVQVGFDEKYKFYHSPNALNDIFSFSMSFTGVIDPSNAFTRLRRIFKYAVKGFTLDQNQLIDLFATIKSNEPKYKFKDSETIPGQLNLFETTINPGFEKVKKEAQEEAKKGYHALVDKKNNITTIEIDFPELKTTYEI